MFQNGGTCFCSLSTIAANFQNFRFFYKRWNYELFLMHALLSNVIQTWCYVWLRSTEKKRTITPTKNILRWVILQCSLHKISVGYRGNLACVLVYRIDQVKKSVICFIIKLIVLLSRWNFITKWRHGWWWWHCSTKACSSISRSGRLSSERWGWYYIMMTSDYGQQRKMYFKSCNTF